MIDFCYRILMGFFTVSIFYLGYNFFLYKRNYIPLKVSQFYAFTTEEKKQWLNSNLLFSLLWFLISFVYMITLYAFSYRSSSMFMDVITVVVFLLEIVLYIIRYYKQVYKLNACQRR